MKKLRILIVLSIVIALVIPFSVFAATSDSTVARTVRGFFGIDFSKLNDEQKNDVETYSQKMADLQKEFINKMVSNGTMTKEQGAAEIKQIDEALTASQDNGTVYGLGTRTRKGFVNGNAKRGFSDKSILDTSKLTDQQKADLKETEKKMANVQKEYIDKIVSFGLLTKEQGDNIKSKLETILSSDIADDPALGMMAGKRGFAGPGLFGIMGTDLSKLTDQQKTELANYSKEMSELQKEMINKFTAYGVMSKEQGDAAIKRIDDMSGLELRMGYSKGMGTMRKGRFNGSVLHGKSDTVSDSSGTL